MSSAANASAADATKTQSSQASHPTDLDRRTPFTVDVLVKWLNAIFLRTPVILALPALLYYYDRSQSVVPTAYPGFSISHVRHLLFTEYKWIGRWFFFGLIKSINHHANRYVANLGAYQADKAD